ncbi:MAG: DUF3427 domain-containing protein [Candidatus Enteromonas sp.]|nr:DUF3427 domain-containing protein [Candidatus Enteromonas sp.]
MKESFLTNYSNDTFLQRLKGCFNKCYSFSLTVSFIKEAGLRLIQKEIENALNRGVKGRIITSTYQNFTDIPSLRIFKKWMETYPNFSCHLDFNSFEDNGFHTKGYIFQTKNGYEFLVGSSNITRFALLKNIEWNVSLTRNKEDKIINEALLEFDSLWNKTNPLSEEIIKKYTTQIEYAIERWDMDYGYNQIKVVPNAMQKAALKEIRRYRDMGEKRALIIAATASGKTFLAAFDAYNFNAKRLLFVVHRDTILNDAKKTFEKIFGSTRTYGLFTGQEKNLDADFIFATNTMMATHLDSFNPNDFDYIIFDECHHITNTTYEKILNYFTPAFLLGLTATPERMDKQDVFAIFNYVVPYELRLRDAINNDLVVPFKYFAVRDEMIDYSDKEKVNFLKNYFKDDNHIQFISNQIEKHRPEGKLKAIGFCRSIDHAREMSLQMDGLGYHTTYLTGENNTGERSKAFEDLADDNNDLEIIFAVDILNEGVDLPSVNMVLFLRPTESQTIFIQQLGRGLRKYKGKDHLTVLDFIGNSYDRSTQIALGLGSLSSSTVLEKALLSSLVRNDFKDLGLPGVEIHFDERSKEEILKHIENTNFNTAFRLRSDYFSFKKYLAEKRYPSHMDYLNSDCAPDLLRFLKAKMKGKKNYSYYNFLRNIGEDVPLFNESEIRLLEVISDLLPLTRREEYLIIKQVLENQIDFDLLTKEYKRVNTYSLKTAVDNLISRKVIINSNPYKLNYEKGKGTAFEDFLVDLLEYGLERYENEFGDFEGPFKMYGNYQKDKIMMEIDGKQYSYMQGTKYDTKNKITYVFVGLEKDKVAKGNFDYKDKFLSPSIFQWESVNKTTKDNAEGKKLLATKIVHLFVRKVDEEDGIVLPFTYFGTGKFTNCRDSQNDDKPTLMFDIELDHEVDEEYRFDFQVPEKHLS